jgi:predicted GH43/DUF377 family glycosyl hydrolase
MDHNPLVTELPLLLHPDPSRVVIRPFIPADDPTIADPAQRSRIGRVMQRVVGLDASAGRAERDRILASLNDRHQNVEQVLRRRFHDLIDPVDYSGPAVSEDEALLIGAYFSEEYSFEAAALFNPSIVAHPDQAGVPPGTIRFVMSLRAVGEGQISSITFRTGLFNGHEVALDPPSETSIAPQIEPIPGGSPDDPGVRLFCGESDSLSAIVIFPVTRHQRHGIEDLRLVRFTDEDGNLSYLGTYTAFSGETIRQELLRTTDFVSFELSAVRGTVADKKGMALFPRRIDGHYAALTRQDHDSIWLLKSNDLYAWEDGHKIIEPRWPWEFVQIGNCGSPIEIDEGWLVLMHGVGAVRNYCIGACLLDKNDPAKLLGRTREPLISTSQKDRDGYVPNVVYSCGGLIHERTLLLPYAIADTLSAFATVPVDALLAAMT